MTNLQLLGLYNRLQAKFYLSSDDKFRALCSRYMRYIADKYWKRTGRLIL